MSDLPVLNGRPYPRPCMMCGRESLQPARIAYTPSINYEGRLAQFGLPELKVDKCIECGEIYFTNESDLQIQHGLRQHLNLLQPEVIRSNLAALQVSQTALADAIGTTPKMVERWLDYLQVQSRAYDQLMRLYFELPAVRQVLDHRAELAHAADRT